MKNPVTRSRALRAALRLACLAATCSGVAAIAATRYECSVLDGSVRVMAQDLSARYAWAVQRCGAFELAPEKDLPRPAVAGAGVQELRSSAEMAFALRALAAATPLERLVDGASRSRGLDPRFVMAVIQVESGYQAQARSPKGALGLMQIMPATGQRFGVESTQHLLDPAVNIDVGTRYLRWLHDRFDGRLDLVLAAYNAGEGAVERHGNRIPPYRETREYVRKILGLYLPSQEDTWSPTPAFMPPR